MYLVTSKDEDKTTETYHFDHLSMTLKIYQYYFVVDNDHSDPFVVVADKGCSYYDRFEENYDVTIDL